MLVKIRNHLVLPETDLKKKNTKNTKIRFYDAPRLHEGYCLLSQIKNFVLHLVQQNYFFCKYEVLIIFKQSMFFIKREVVRLKLTHARLECDRSSCVN